MNGHIINGHYMFGNTFIQPEMPMYNKIPHHNMAPVKRPMPPYPDLETRPNHCVNKKPGCSLGYEDTANRIDTPYDDSAYEDNRECTDCPLITDDIIRDPLAYSVIEIATSIVKTLKVNIYAIDKNQDKTIEMRVGNRYAITYLTEHGLIVSVGRLEIISDSVPDDCTRYIKTTNMSAASTAYIGMDCSTEGNSDKRKIYIATIRNIQELNDEIMPEEEESIKSRLDKLFDAIENGDLVFCKNCSCNNTTPEDNNGSDDNTTPEGGNNESGDDITTPENGSDTIPEGGNDNNESGDDTIPEDGSDTTPEDNNGSNDDTIPEDNTPEDGNEPGDDTIIKDDNNELNNNESASDSNNTSADETGMLAE